MLADAARRRLAVVASLVLIAAVTLVPQFGAAWPHAFWCWGSSCGAPFDAVELAGNIALFVPFGLAVRGVKRASWRAIAAIIGTTVTVEALQYFVVVGRTGTIRDCIANAAGGLIAYAAAPHVALLWRPTTRAARRFAWAAAAVWIAHAAFTMIAFRASATPHRFFAQLAPELGQFDAFHGTVDRASVNGALVYSGPFPPGLTPEAWTSEPIELSAAVRLGPLPVNLAPILSIFDAAQNEIALLGQRRNDLVFRTRVRGEDWGLRMPAVVLDRAFPSVGSGQRRLASGLRKGYTLTASVVASPSDRRTTSLALTPSLGWTLWWPLDVPSRVAIAWLTWLWLALPIGAIALWSRRARQSGGSLSGLVSALPLVVAVAGAHVVVPFACAVESYGRWPDAIAMAVAVVSGLALGAFHRSGSRA